MHAGVIEFDALADPVRTAAEHHDLAVRADRNLVRRAGVGRVIVIRILDAADRNQAERGGTAELKTALAHLFFRNAEEFREIFVREAEFLGLNEQLVRQCHPGVGRQLQLEVGQLLDLLQEITGDPGQGARLVDRKPLLERLVEVEKTFAGGRGNQRPELFERKFLDFLDHAEPGPADFERTDRFLERLLEIFADAHDFADRLHLRAEPVLGLRELLERPARKLHDDVITRRRVFLQRSVAPVRQLVERDSGRQLR